MEPTFWSNSSEHGISAGASSKPPQHVLQQSFWEDTSKAPSSHLQTLGDEDPYVFTGNRHLCNHLVPESCSEHKENPVDDEEEEHTDAYDVTLYVVSGLGFGIGFTAIWWLLIVGKAASTWHFHFIDSTCEKIFGLMVLLMMKVSRKLLERNGDSVN